MPRLSRSDALYVIDALSILAEQPDKKAMLPGIERVLEKLTQRLAQNNINKPDHIEHTNTVINKQEKQTHGE